MASPVARTYIRRRGRMTRAQARALDTLAGRYCLDASAPIDWQAVVPRPGPVVVEVGFGMGQALIALAERRPEIFALGIEVYRPGIGAALNAIERLGLDNVRLIEGDAREILSMRVPPGSVDAVHVFFPDPWPKKRHAKRRLLTAEFAEACRRVLKPGGVLKAATDWQTLAEWMLAELTRAPGLANVAGPGRYAERAPERPTTRFEARGVALGHQVRDLAFVRS